MNIDTWNQAWIYVFVFVSKGKLKCQVRHTVSNSSSKQIKTQLWVEPWAKELALTVLWLTAYAVCPKPGVSATSGDRKRWKASERELRKWAIPKAKNSHKGTQALVYVWFSQLNPTYKKRMQGTESWFGLWLLEKGFSAGMVHHGKLWWRWIASGTTSFRAECQPGTGLWSCLTLRSA